MSDHDKPHEPEDTPHAAPEPTAPHAPDHDTHAEASPAEAQAVLHEVEHEAAAEAHGHDEHVEPAHPEPTHDDAHGAAEDHHAPAEAHVDEQGHDTHGHEDHAHAVAAHDDHVHAEPTHAAAHDDHSHAVTTHDDHGHAEAAHQPGEAHHPAETVSEPAHHAEDAAVAGAAAAAVGAAAATASAPASRPIWSDNGDAPFDEVDERPVYARSGGRKAKKKSEGFFSELWDIIKTVVYALAIAMVVRIFFFQPFTIPSASMEPNLYEGDYIVVSKWSYGYSRHSIPWSPPIFEGRIMGRQAERGDIVVFKRPNNDGGGYTDYIKRIIGVPGDRVQMISNVLHINGQPVEDVEVEATQVRGAFGAGGPSQLRETLPGGAEFRIQDYGPGSPSDDTDVFVVPDGHYFVMGDNRDDSMDSRYPWEVGGVGLVPEENLVGKAQVILFSWTPGASLLNVPTWFTNVRPERFFTDLE